MLRKFEIVRDQTGATAVEYGLIAALIVLACVGGIAALGGGVDQHYQDIENSV